uniref:Uncharacterized protein n=1 Tax=Timema bartmani TaxID=61472 RepID=A0A7R9F5T1_9NEOP|nr:unnamed protein product [Timema bartmani]
MEELVDQLSSPVNTSDAIMLTTLLSVLVLVAVEGTIEPLDEGKKQVLWTIRGTNQDTYRGATALHCQLEQQLLVLVLKMRPNSPSGGIYKLLHRLIILR